MSVFFGTDGIRGVVNKDLNFDVAYKVGNSLSQVKKGRVLIGYDTRVSATYLCSAIASGLMAGGSEVCVVGIVPTAGIAYLTKNQKFDYGIAITASHNQKEYNGIKIFSSLGEKLPDSEEEKIERGLIKNICVDANAIGRLSYQPRLKKRYMDFLLESKINLDGLKIVIDGSNGAAYSIAPKVFEKLGAKVFKINCKPLGTKINEDCGSLHPEKLCQKVVSLNADIGLGFDGDADRLIAVNEKGQIVNGDQILTAIALYLKSRGELNQNVVVGTSMTNMGIERELEKNSIKLLRADVGDKYVASIMFGQGLSLGGEQSGHIIISKYLHTGDGILTAITLLSAMLESKKTLSQFCSAEIFPQVIKNVLVKEKLRILGSETLSNAIASVQQELSGNGRVLVRASGTEPKIRVMVESENFERSSSLASYLVSIISSLERAEDKLCVE